VAAALDSVDAPSVLYAGVSLGGAVGLELALRHPERVDALSVICSGATIATSDLWRDRAASIRIAGTASLCGPSAGRWFAPASRVRHPDATAGLLASLADVDDESYALCCEALASYDVRDELGALSLPVQVMWGEFDTVSPEVGARYVAARVANADLVEVRDVAHLAPAERPDEVVRLLEAFFARTAVAA
jgi:pimeloyl-ACP methyl ester carboxylesterase